VKHTHFSEASVKVTENFWLSDCRNNAVSEFKSSISTRVIESSRNVLS
jgi:hypothetical protein